MSEDGVVASVAPVSARTLEDFSRAITELLDEMAASVPDEGEASEEAKAHQQALEMQLHDLLSREADKVDRTADVLRVFEHAADTCKEEADRLKKRGKVFENKRARLVGYILDVMERWGVKKLEGTKSTLTRIQNTDTLDVEDPAALPFKFQRWTFTFIPTSEEQVQQMKDLLVQYAGSYEVTSDKRPLLEHVKLVEKRVNLALKTGETLGEAEVIPDGVALNPGTWRLSVR